jgi:hypothetical protein
METVLLFGVAWIVFAVLIVTLNDQRSTLAFLGLNLTIAAFLLFENDLIGALAQATFWIASPIIILLAVARTKQPHPRFGTLQLFCGALLTIALSFAVGFLVQSLVPAERVTETYFLIALFGLAFLIIVSQTSLQKFLLGILVLESVGTLLLAWGEDTALLTVVEGAFVVLITLTVAFIAVKDFAEYGTIDSSKMTELRG